MTTIDVDAAVAAYIRAYVRERLEKVGSTVAGKEFDASHSWVIKAAESEPPLRPMPKTLRRVAEILHNGSHDALQEAAILYAERNPDEVPGGPDRRAYAGAILVHEHGFTPDEASRYVGAVAHHERRRRQTGRDIANAAIEARLADRSSRLPPEPTRDPARKKRMKKR